MKISIAIIVGIVGISLLGGCACNPGYYAPPYKLVISRCVPAFVPTR